MQDAAKLTEPSSLLPSTSPLTPPIVVVFAPLVDQIHRLLDLQCLSRAPLFRFQDTDADADADAQTVLPMVRIDTHDPTSRKIGACPFMLSIARDNDRSILLALDPPFTRRTSFFSSGVRRLEPPPLGPAQKAAALPSPRRQFRPSGQPSRSRRPSIRALPTPPPPPSPPSSDDNDGRDRPVVVNRARTAKYSKGSK